MYCDQQFLYVLSCTEVYFPASSKINLSSKPKPDNVLHEDLLPINIVEIGQYNIRMEFNSTPPPSSIIVHCREELPLLETSVMETSHEHRTYRQNRSEHREDSRKYFNNGKKIISKRYLSYRRLKQTLLSWLEANCNTNATPPHFTPFSIKQNQLGPPFHQWLLYLKSLLNEILYINVEIHILSYTSLNHTLQDKPLTTDLLSQLRIPPNVHKNSQSHAATTHRIHSTKTNSSNTTATPSNLKRSKQTLT